MGTDYNELRMSTYGERTHSSAKIVCVFSVVYLNWYGKTMLAEKFLQLTYLYSFTKIFLSTLVLFRRHKSYNNLLTIKII